ncbi:MAG: PilZ domain-containing protein [Oceanospirillaceae bacterium]|nr:PilZ domain-containing protein [Oceanospirillaceae bacterium]
MSEEKSQRRFDRVAFDAECELHINGQPPAVVELHDISLKGALVEAKSEIAMEIGGAAELVLYLSNEVMIRMPSILRSKRGLLLGFEVDKLDLDSIAHLRRLIELNLGSEEAVHRNLEALIKS